MDDIICFHEVMFSSLPDINFFNFFAIPSIIEVVTLGVFRRTEISAVHAINFFEFSHNPLDFRDRDIRELLQRGDFLVA